MLGLVDTYWVAMCKGDSPLYLVAGPFGLSDQADAAMEAMKDPGGTCYLAVVSSKITVEGN